MDFDGVVALMVELQLELVDRVKLGILDKGEEEVADLTVSSKLNKVGEVTPDSNGGARRGSNKVLAHATRHFEADLAVSIVYISGRSQLRGDQRSGCEVEKSENPAAPLNPDIQGKSGQRPCGVAVRNPLSLQPSMDEFNGVSDTVAVIEGIHELAPSSGVWERREAEADSVDQHALQSSRGDYEATAPVDFSCLGGRRLL
jgi:hypothetical protein